MKSAISVPAELLQQSLLTLKKQASERDSALEKLAQLENDFRVAESVLEMVQAGIIDPTDSMTKFAEYRDKPELIELTKQAAKLGYAEHNTGFGELVLDSSKTFSEASPESRLLSRLEGFSR